VQIPKGFNITEQKLANKLRRTNPVTVTITQWGMLMWQQILSTGKLMLRRECEVLWVASRFAVCGACSCACNGHRDRSRRIGTQAQHNGVPCGSGEGGPAGTQEVAPCNVGSAACGAGVAVNCELSEWGTWEQCSASCGGGQQERRRVVSQEPENLDGVVNVAKGGSEHNGLLDQYENCNPEPCKPSIDCSLTVWSDWGAACSCACKYGHMDRSRRIGTQAQQ